MSPPALRGWEPLRQPRRPWWLRGPVRRGRFGDEQTWGDLTASLSEAINQHGGSLFRQIRDQTVVDVVDSAATRQAITYLDYPVDGEMSV